MRAKKEEKRKGKVKGNHRTRKNSWLKNILNEIKEGKEIPEDWKAATIKPIYKKGNKEDPGNYRGIVLLNTAFKIFTSIINNRLIKEIEEKEIIGEWQKGFRKGRGTIENIYIIKKTMDRELKKKGGRVYAYYIDLRAAFDNINRQKLWEKMDEIGIIKSLTKVIRRIYAQTKNRE